MHLGYLNSFFPPLESLCRHEKIDIILNALDNNKDAINNIPEKYISNFILNVTVYKSFY